MREVEGADPDLAEIQKTISLHELSSTRGVQRRLSVSASGWAEHAAVRQGFLLVERVRSRTYGEECEQLPLVSSVSASASEAGRARLTSDAVRLER